MISPVKAYKASDGSIWASPEEAQEAELRQLLQTDLSQLIAALIAQKVSQESGCECLVACLINHREKLIDILTTGPRSRPARRSINGGTTKRAKRPKQPALASPEVAAMGFQAMREAAGQEVEA